MLDIAFLIFIMTCQKTPLQLSTKSNYIFCSFTGYGRKEKAMSLKAFFAVIAVAGGISIFGASDAFAASKTVTLKEGDTLSSVADANATTYVRIFNANDKLSNPDVIYAGDAVRIPEEKETLPDRYGEFLAAQQAAVVAAPAAAAPVYEETYQPAAPAAYEAPAAPAASSNYSVASGNSYVWGNCTWYVKNMRPDIGSFWGDAGAGWIYNAQAAGFATGSAPAVGAIAVETGHVAYVTAVGNGTVTVSEMNFVGLGVVSSRTVPTSSFTYIY